jgi:RHS repeat-associated protein
MSTGAELDGQNNVVSRFVYATQTNVPDYMMRGGHTYRLITDQLGSVRLVVDVASGAVAKRLDYDGFGNVVTDTNPVFQPFGLYDPLTGLTRFGSRDYDAAVGRWTTRDVLRFAGGDTNFYAYAANDPVNQRDPRGLLLGPAPALLAAGGETANAGATAAGGGSLGAAAAAGGALALAAGDGVGIGLLIDHYFGDQIQNALDWVFGDPTLPGPLPPSCVRPRKDPRPPIFPPFDPDNEPTRPGWPSDTRPADPNEKPAAHPDPIRQVPITQPPNIDVPPIDPSEIPTVVPVLDP